jgi:cytoskeletal protein CcmA (bactofilin family)
MWKSIIVGKDGVTKENRPANSVDTLIGRQTELKGDVHFSGGLHIDGKIKGKILADADKSAVLSISETGHIEGDVRVSHVVLNGTIVGDVYASQRITLSSKARVTGNVYYRIIEMTSGATVNGQLVYQGDAQAGAITHEDQADQQENTALRFTSNGAGHAERTGT